MPESKIVGELVSVIPDLSDVMQVVEPDMFDIARNKIIAAPYTLRDYAHPVAVKENNKLIGYRLQPKKEWYSVSDIGVEPDDVVTAVNDIRLNDPKNATRALRELITAKEVFITIKRGDDELRFKVGFQ
jgi:general secretion pathway protein C